MLPKSWVAGLALLTLVATGAAQVHRLPKPQIESAAGQLAPDFTLLDQSGNEFRVSSLRGNRVLLIFYRGYW
jgi:cytochrome oxidase Cu insertion factor (SCO1/SenC/PrrC family)